MSQVPQPVNVHHKEASPAARPISSCLEALPHEAPARYRLLAFRGELDLSRRTEVEQKLAWISDCPGFTTLVDLTDVRYVDTMFLNALLRAIGGSPSGTFDGRVCIVASHTVSRLFSLTGLDRIFPIFADLSSARRFARGTPIRAFADISLSTHS